MARPKKVTKVITPKVIAPKVQVPKKIKVTPTKKDKDEEIEYELVFEQEPVKKMSSPQMSLYEYAALINAHACSMMRNNNVPLEYPPSMGIIDIAICEVRKRNTTLVVSRTDADGSVENWKIEELVFPR